MDEFISSRMAQLEARMAAVEQQNKEAIDQLTETMKGLVLMSEKIMPALERLGMLCEKEPPIIIPPRRGMN